MMDHTLLQ